MIRLAAALALLLSPAMLTAQESEVSRRTYTFINDRLVVSVVGGGAGALQILRGEPGRIEVAARSREGFPGFGLGGTLTRELRLTAPGAEQVQFLVVVPERVAVTVRLPHGETRQPPGNGDAVSYQWGGAPETVSELPLRPTLAGGLELVHATRRAPSVVDVPDILAVRSLSLRIEGSDFRIGASRPLSLEAGGNSRVELHTGGAPTDIVIYVPRGTGLFQLRAAGTPIAEVVSGRGRPLCDGVAVQSPTPAQDWLTFYLDGGMSECR